MSTRRSIWSALLACVALFTASAAFADVSGTWALSVETPQGTGTPTLVLKQDGDKLSGTYRGQLGEYPVTGTATGDDFSVVVSVSVQGQDLQITYTGKVDGASMSGKAVFGSFGEGNFTGKKQ